MALVPTLLNIDMRSIRPKLVEDLRQECAAHLRRRSGQRRLSPVDGCVSGQAKKTHSSDAEVGPSSPCSACCRTPTRHSASIGRYRQCAPNACKDSARAGTQRTIAPDVD